jgi:hypothetical protein
MEEVLSNDQQCTWLCQTHEDHGKQSTSGVSTIKQPNGQYNQTKKTLKVLYKSSFSWFKTDWRYRWWPAEPGHMWGHNQQEKLEPVQTSNQSKSRWILSTFQQFKSVGTDGIVPAFLQWGAEYLVPYLYCIFKACIWIYPHGLEAWSQGSLIT